MSKDRTEVARVALKRTVARAEAEWLEAEPQLAKAAQSLGIDYMILARQRLSLAWLDLIPREIAERHQLLPIDGTDTELLVAMSDPENWAAREELSFVTGKDVRAVLVSKAELTQTLQRAYLARRRGETFLSGVEYRGETAEPVDEEDPDFVPAHGELTSLVDSPKGEGGTGLRGAQTTGAGQPSAELAFDSPTSRRDLGSVPLPLPEPLVPDPPSQPRAAVGGALAGTTVLVVDDDAAIRNLIRKLLESRSAACVCGTSGEEALTLLREHHPDLVVLDAMLPGLHGFEVVRRMRGSRRFGTVPIIMVSAVHRGWAIAEDLKTSAGVDSYLEKPFSLDRLNRAVDRALGREGERAEARDHLKASQAALREGKLEEALELVQRGLKEDPASYDLYLQLGVVEGRRGRPFEAIAALEHACQLDSKGFAAVRSLAILYQKTGFRMRSLELWRRALDLSPNEQVRRSIEEQLAALS